MAHEQPNTHMPIIPLIKLVKTVNGIPPDPITGNVVVSGGGGETLQEIFNNDTTPPQVTTDEEIRFVSDDGDSSSISISNQRVVIQSIDNTASTSANITIDGTTGIHFAGIVKTYTFYNLTNAVNDAAAETAGVPVDGIYRNGSVLMIRVS